MKQDTFISIDELATAVSKKYPILQFTIWDSLADWLDGSPYYFISFNDSSNFDSLPKEAQEVLKEQLPENFYGAIYYGK